MKMEDELGQAVKRPRHESPIRQGREAVTLNGEASVDSGLSDVATPTPELPSDSPVEPRAGPSRDIPEDDDDNLSEISGLSDMSGKNWKPNMSGRLSWLHRAMARGTDPRSIVANVFENSSIPEGLDDMTIWKILYNIFAEPPKREKLKEFNTLEQVVAKIKEARNIIVLTGAGVSVSCGIPDFRSKDGVYARLAVDFPDLPDPQAMFDIHYFRKDPRPFFKFAKEIYPGQFQPSPCHKFIKCIESAGKLLRNYTQNIDTLEQVAGISRVVQCHGSFATASCTICRLRVQADIIRSEIFEQRIPLCSRCPKPDLQSIIAELARPKESARSTTTTSPPTPTVPSIDKTDTTLTASAAATATSDAAGLEEASTAALDGLSSASSAAAAQLPRKMLNSAELPSEPFPSPPSASHHRAASPSSGGAAVSSSPFTSVPVMKPDIVFFGEGLPEEFHSAIAADKEQVDLLIVIGSSLKVRPVALIPSSIPENIPQILINREPLNHLRFDVELLGDCDTIINQICHMLGEGWSGPIHRPPQAQTDQMPTLDDSGEQGAAGSLDGRETRPGSSSGGREGEGGENSSISREEDSQDKDDWRPRASLAERIPEDQFLFIPPSRYVFSGAEVYPEDLSSSDDSEEEEEEGEQEDEEEEEETDELNTSQSVDLVTSDLRDEDGPSVEETE